MGTLHDVLFVGTSHGRLLKISSNSNTLIEAIQVFPYHVPVRNILVSDSDQIIILSDHEVSLFYFVFVANICLTGDTIRNIRHCIQMF